MAYIIHNSPLKFFLFLLIVLLLGCGNQDNEVKIQPDLTPKRIILIGIDTLRADHLSCYGYPINTSPAIDTFAQGATLFEQSISQSSWTLPSFASIFTGVYSFEHKAGIECGQRVKAEGDNAPVTILDTTYPTLAELLRTRGYKTAAFTEGGYMSPGFGLARGFDLFEICSVPRNKSNKDRAQHILNKDVKKVVDASLNWIKSNRRNNFFLFMHTYEPHTPLRDPLKVLPQVKKEYVQNKFFEVLRGYLQENISSESTRAALEKYTFDDVYAWICNERMLYDCEILYTDHHMGRFFKELKEMGLYDDSLIIFTSDHGAEFCEHGGMYHAKTLFQESIFVPMIVKKPNQKKGVRIASPLAEGIDIMPTVLEACKINSNTPKISGTNLFVKKNTAIARSHLFKNRKTLAAGIQDTIKIIYNYKNPEDTLLFQLDRDPFEKESIYSKDAAAVIPELIAPLSMPKVDEALCLDAKDNTVDVRNQLKSLGYIQ